MSADANFEGWCSSNSNWSEIMTKDFWELHKRVFRNRRGKNQDGW